MTVYFIEREYESNIRIEVDDDTTVSFRQGYEESKNSVVFTKPSVRYDSETLAAFSDVKTLRREGVNVQYLVQRETKGGKKVTEPTYEQQWTSVEDLKGNY